MTETSITTPRSFAGFAGIARRDITPLVGIYSRTWGAAAHDTAEGVHRPITTTALAIRDHEDSLPLLLVSMDWCVLADPADISMIRDPLVKLVGGETSRMILACTHTHGVGFITSSRTHLPGGNLIPQYLKTTRDAVVDAAREAIENSARCPCTMTWAEGSCSLAANRDMQDPKMDRYICGFNPETDADDTLLVGRITRDSDNAPMATVVNYACHPTTLAWDNKLLSPDYVGAMREVVEEHTGGSCCLFLQGASGELAPRHQYVGDPVIADKHGRQLGYAVLSTLESMLAPRMRLEFVKVVESGAPLAVWQPRPFNPSSILDATTFDVELPLKPLPAVEELQREIESSSDRALTERVRRKMELVEKLGGGPVTQSSAWLWRMGDTLLFAQPNEPYSDFQIALRQRFKKFAVVVASVANGAVGYIVPNQMQGKNLYQAWQSPFDFDSLPRLTNTCIRSAEKLLANG